MNQKLSTLLVFYKTPLKEAMRAIDQNGLGIIFIVNRNKKLLGVVTDGDIRKSILNGTDTRKPVIDITNTNPAVINGTITRRKLDALGRRKDILPTGGSLKIPILDKAGKVKDTLFLYSDERKNVLFSKSTAKGKMSAASVKKILIIGGAGYFGSVLARKLLAQNFYVRILDTLTYGKEGIQSLPEVKNFDFMQGDCGSISDLLKAMKGMDAVIHLAAIVGDPACALNPEETIKTNFLATKLIAESAKFNQINRLLFISSCSVYGASKANERLIETSPLNPVSLYARTKLDSEEAILGIVSENFSPTIFRFATLYGVSPRMRFDLVINTLTAQAYTKKRITIFGGQQYRPFLEVSDAAGACLAWIRAPINTVRSEIFNVGSDEQNHRIQEIGAFIKHVLPDTLIRVRQDDTDKRDYNVSFRKIRETLNFQPKKTIQKSVHEMTQLLKQGVVEDSSHAKYNNYKSLL